MDKFWDKKIETSTTITYEGNKQFEKEDYHFIITLRDNELSQIEVKHIVPSIPFRLVSLAQGYSRHSTRKWLSGSV